MLLFGNMMIRPIDIRRHDVSAKRRFHEMTFRKNDLAPRTIVVKMMVQYNY